MNIDAPPGVLTSPPELHRVKMISPSRFAGFQECALREVWAANRTPPLLPTSPAARLGTVAHRLLEEAGRGRLHDGDPDRRWNQLLSTAEQMASRSWLDRHLLPLRTAIPDFEVRKLQAVTRARQLASQAAAMPPPEAASTQPAIGYEMPVETPNGKAGGKIDAIVAGDTGPVVKDYKSGAIFEPRADNGHQLKEAYAIQLKLYAAIYSAMTGTWPSSLEIVPLAGAPQLVEFTTEECAQLLENAIRALDAVNDVISSQQSAAARRERLAGPSPRTCRHCPYRPSCAPYANAVAHDPEADWPWDRHGLLLEMRALGNGRLMLALDTGTATVRIRGVDPTLHRHPALGTVVLGDAIGAYNLRPAGSPTSFAEGRFTVFYKLGQLMNDERP